MKENKTVRVKKFYNSFVKIYDLLKIPWNKIFSQKAEKKFSEFLTYNLDQETSVLELGCGTGLNLEKIYNVSSFHRFSAGMVSVVEINKEQK